MVWQPTDFSCLLSVPGKLGSLEADRRRRRRRGARKRGPRSAELGLAVAGRPCLADRSINATWLRQENSLASTLAATYFAAHLLT